MPERPFPPAFPPPCGAGCHRRPPTCVTKQTLSVPRTAMAVSPLLLAALNAYSTWYSRPSGLKMVLQRAVDGREDSVNRAGEGGASSGCSRTARWPTAQCLHVAVIAAAAA